MSSTDLLGPQITFFFRDYLLGQRGASVHTVHSYRDTIKLLLCFVAQQTKKDVSDIVLDDFDAAIVLAFLDYLEKERGVSPNTRNQRLTAIRTFFRIVAANVPTAFEQCQRILVIPKKRTRQKPVDYLEQDEMEALLSVIDRTSHIGRRDYALLALMYNCGSRIQETLNLNARDICLTKPFHVRFFGKGRKERISPLWSETVAVLRNFFEERGIEHTSGDPIFVNNCGQRLARDGAALRLTKYAAAAAERVPSIAGKSIHPHSIRHTTAMHLLRSGVDRNAIGDILGHAPNSRSTERYAHADLEMKRKAIESCAPSTKTKKSKWKTPEVMQYLESL